MEPLTNEAFVSYLRSALHYIYDPVHLRRSPLVGILGMEKEFDAAAALQRCLTSAIGALKPAEDEPPQSYAWRVYDTLNLQYIRQFSRDVVCTQLGISERQLRREQRLALEALALHLEQRYGLVTTTEEPGAEPAATAESLPKTGPLGFAPAPQQDHALNAELTWLENPAQEQQSAGLEEALYTVYSLAQPLARQWNAPLRLSVDPGAADFPVSQPVIRSTLLTLLSVLIPRAGASEVTLSAVRQEASIEIQVAADGPGQPPFNEQETASLETARRLAHFTGAQLSVQPGPDGLTACLSLAAPEQVTILVIDDNPDWLDMLKRYAVGSRYKVVGTREPENACALAEKLQPAVIFLDVMMPNTDGWQTFSELRAEQATSQIPIVICTVLPLEGLALSLGVNAFLQKPVTQEQFLAAIERQIPNIR